MSIYHGWTEDPKHAAARLARRNAEHERIMAEKAAEAAQLSNIRTPSTVAVAAQKDQQ